MLATTEVRDAMVGDFGEMAMVYRRASLSNEGDRSLLLAHPEYLDLSADAVLAGRSLVAVVKGRVVGFASVVAVEDGVDLEAIFVDPDWMPPGRFGTGGCRGRASRSKRKVDDHRERQLARVGVRGAGRVRQGRHGRARVRRDTPDGVVGHVRGRRHLAPDDVIGGLDDRVQPATEPQARMRVGSRNPAFEDGLGRVIRTRRSDGSAAGPT